MKRVCFKVTLKWLEIAVKAPSLREVFLSCFSLCRWKTPNKGKENPPPPPSSKLCFICVYHGFMLRCFYFFFKYFLLFIFLFLIYWCYSLPGTMGEGGKYKRLLQMWNQKKLAWNKQNKSYFFFFCYHFEDFWNGKNGKIQRAHVIGYDWQKNQCWGIQNHSNKSSVEEAFAIVRVSLWLKYWISIYFEEYRWKKVFKKVSLMTRISFSRFPSN